MKVIVVNTYKDKGGAARAARRLCDALACLGVEVVYLNCWGIGESPWKRLRFYLSGGWDRIRGVLAAGRRVYFSSGGIRNSALIRQINRSDADLVHLHWVNAGALSVSDINRINKPIVWSLHDMWAFTGGCHYDEACGRYEVSCGACPILGSSRAKDLSRENFRRKREAFQAIEHLTVVGLSRWLTKCAARSRIFLGRDVINLPNPINTSVFAPKPRFDGRKKFGLSSTKKMILFGAMSAADDRRKGYRELLAALRLMSMDNIELVVFGTATTITEEGISVRSVGTITDDAKLALLYSAADVLVVPSLQENLSNAIMESLSCGTPVVAFDIGGNSDMIDHERCGYLADAYSPEDLAAGIEWVLCNQDYEGLRKRAREKVVSTFDQRVVAARYIEMYNKILRSKSDEK